MKRKVLGRMDFRGPEAGWTWPPVQADAIERTRAGKARFVINNSLERQRG